MDNDCQENRKLFKKNMCHFVFGVDHPLFTSEVVNSCKLKWGKGNYKEKVKLFCLLYCTETRYTVENIAKRTTSLPFYSLQYILDKL